jgi:superfamily I DNA/RNA helicase
MWGNWPQVPKQGDRLVELLKDLAAAGQAFDQVFALTPFRAVAHHLEEIGTAYPGITAGTVHRSQGREADIVILVLGGDPASPGAKRWAARKPNLVNVAATRAKRRLYVIGDRSAWAEYRYFDVLAARLPTRVSTPARDLELP